MTRRVSWGRFSQTTTNQVKGVIMESLITIVMRDQLWFWFHPPTHTTLPRDFLVLDFLQKHPADDDWMRRGEERQKKEITFFSCQAKTWSCLFGCILNYGLANFYQNHYIIIWESISDLKGWHYFRFFTAWISWPVGGGPAVASRKKCVPVSISIIITLLLRPDLGHQWRPWSQLRPVMVSPRAQVWGHWSTSVCNLGPPPQLWGWIIEI